jgi:hypothetical protein
VILNIGVLNLKTNLKSSKANFQTGLQNLRSLVKPKLTIDMAIKLKLGVNTYSSVLRADISMKNALAYCSSASIWRQKVL